MRYLILAILVSLAGLAGHAQAQQGQGLVRPPSIGNDDLRRPIQPIKSRQQAIAEAVGRYGGEVLSARVKRSGDSSYYEVRLISAGQVRVVRIDARPSR